MATTQTRFLDALEVICARKKLDLRVQPSYSNTGHVFVFTSAMDFGKPRYHFQYDFQATSAVFHGEDLPVGTQRYDSGALAEVLAAISRKIG